MTTGLYVASNTTALGAQINLQRNMGQLEEIITRLSTGLRINSGKDDPSGLIASELLKSDITATKQAIQNTTRANHVISIADSALGQISALLNDIRGLINASANTGSMTEDQIKANQLQVDASLDSIDRIAKTTNYQGQLLLDGSFDFVTQGVDRNMISNVRIDNANFGMDPAVDVAIDVLEDAETAKLFYSYGSLAENTVIEVGGNNGRHVFKFDAGATVNRMAEAINAMSDSTGVRAVVGAEATHGQILLTSAGANNDINLTAKNAGFDSGNYAFKFTAGNSEGINVVITEPGAGNAGVIDFQLQMEPWSNATASIDESQVGVNATSFDFQNGKITIDTTQGKKIYTLNLVAAQTGNRTPELTGPVAVDLDKSGTMNVEYHAASTTTLQDIVDAINKSYPELKAYCELNDPAIASVDYNKDVGKIYGKDLRTNNAIQITASHPGQEMNNNDIVFVNNNTMLQAMNSACCTAVAISTPQRASASVYTVDGEAGCFITLSALEDGAKYNCTNIVVLAGDTDTKLKASGELGGTITIQLEDGVDRDDVTAAMINQALKDAGFKLEVSSDGTSDTVLDSDYLDALESITLGQYYLKADSNKDPTTISGGDLMSSNVGTDGETVLDVNEDNEVSILYATKKITAAQYASGCSCGVRISADKTGSEFNGITFTFQCGSGDQVTATQRGNIIVIDTGCGGFAGLNANSMNDALKAAGLRYTVDTSSNFTMVDDLTTISIGVYDDGGYNTFGLSHSEVPATLVLDADNKVISVQDTVSYNNLAQRASTTVFDGANYLTFTGGIASGEFNGTNIKIENDSLNYIDGRIAVAYNRDNGVLQIIGDLANASYSNLMEMVRKATEGAITVSIASDPNAVNNTTVGSTRMTALAQSVQNNGGAFALQLGDRNTSLNVAVVPGGAIQVVGGRVGTDHGAIVYNAQRGVTTGNDVVANINKDSVVGKLVTAENNVDSTGEGLIFLPTDNTETLRYFSKAMQGGYSGTNTVVTADELIDFINSHEQLKEMFYAERAVWNDGSGLLSLFQEYALYDPENTIGETALQFLGPAGSPNIEFVAGKGFENQELSIAFVNDPTSKPEASLTATNPDAALSITATVPGLQYDDVAVRFVRLDNNFTSEDNYATYESGATVAIAYCDINSTLNGTADEIGNFILTANAKGDTYNNVEIMVQLDSAQTEAAVATFDPDKKRLVISVNDIEVQLQQAFAAIEKEGTFTADYDYSYNANPYSDPGMCDFTQLLKTASQRAPVSIGTTGNTGGHTGGLITVYLGGKDTEITAQAAIDAINNSVQTKNLFSAMNYSGTDGSGLLNIRQDTLLPVADECGRTVPDYKMVLRNPNSECADGSSTTMVIYLETDRDGNSLTTAKDLVDFFETLTPEETRGISVSLLRPAGYPNVPDDFCVEEVGRGILQATGYYDECDNYISNPIRFFSANTVEDLEKQPSGRVVAVNGDSASLDIFAKQPGTAYEGVTLQYQNIIDPDTPPSVEFNPATKVITVNIKQGQTTAAQVKDLLENSEATKGLFYATLVNGTGEGLVSTSDNSLSLSGGTYTSGTPGGAYMQGAADEDPNRLVLESIYEGSNQKVTVRVIEGRFETKDIYGRNSEEAIGSDMKAQMNGVDMIGEGRTLTIRNPMMDMTVTMDDSVRAGDSTSFRITGGGATFQLGPDVVSSQQIRIGIPSVNTTRLGGLSGYLYQLKSGEVAALDTDTKLADRIIQEAIISITSLRGRLGALQKCTLEPNMAALEDTVEQMSAAEADISNADFAVESSRLTRTQILVQSGAQVLGIANQLPQYASMLIGQ